MKKFKKLAIAVVSIVMAGAMLVPFAACTKPGDTPGGDNPGNTPGNTPGGDNPGGNTPTNPTTPVVPTEFDRGTKPNLPANLTPNVDADDLPTYGSNVTLKTAIGYKNLETGIKFETAQITQLAGSASTSVKIADQTYVSGDLKPAWRALQTKLNVSFSDDWSGMSAGDMINDLKTKDTINSYSLITASADTILTEQAANQRFLNIADYLYYMPNYKAFLDANPIVRLSLTADADPDSSTYGAMYMLPYFDGNDDIEKYVLMRKDVVEKLLDATDLSAATDTFASQATAKNAHANKGVVSVVGTSTSVTSFMGTTSADNYKIAVTDPSVLTGTPDWGNNKSEVDKSDVNNIYKTIDIIVDYGAALTAAKDDTTPLGAAVKAAAGKTYDGSSGNIVDLQNFAINAKSGNVTGAQLTKILQEYIKVAYHKDGDSSQFYTTLSDVFNSAYAAWDVDLYVALGRCVVTSTSFLGSSSRAAGATYMLGSRTGFTDRTYDIASMAGELYGIRGLTSRYANLYAYINSNGDMKDARGNADTWEALARMSDLAKEGLYYTGTGAQNGYASIAGNYNSNAIMFMSSTDYVQTQTAKGGFGAEGVIKGNPDVEEGYNYAPILTPVSRWDTDDDGEYETVMRFTESWRGVKDGGLAIPVASVTGNSEKLAAVLAFIDYLYSNDGQILTTFGPQSTNGNGSNANGLWYANKASLSLEDAIDQGIVTSYDGKQYVVVNQYDAKGNIVVDNTAQYFCYNNELYTGTYYNGKMTPTVTDENLNILYNVSDQNFTNHARYYLGTCLNLGVKSQSFEYQCTSRCGIVGADIWAIASVNGTIKHTVQTIDEDNWWYTLTPTTLPFQASDLNSMSSEYKYISGKGGDGYNLFYADDQVSGNLLTDIMYYGFNSSQALSLKGAGNIPGSAVALVSLLNNTYHLNVVTGEGTQQGNLTINSFMTDAWWDLQDYYYDLIG